jgi:hypothetical protein
VLSTIAVIVVNGLASTGRLGGQTTGDISDGFKVYFVPAGYVFSIWGLIYLALIGYSIFQALPAQRENPRLQRTGWLYALSCAANIAWILLWHDELRRRWTLVAMVALLLLLIAIYLRLGTGFSRVPAAETWLVRVPFSIYLGWITVATIANVTTLLYDLGWKGWGLWPEWWAVIMLVAATIIASAVSITRGDIAYVAVIVWAFVGIALKHSDTMIVTVAAWAAAIVVALTLFIGVPHTQGRLREMETDPPSTGARDRW